MCKTGSGGGRGAAGAARSPLNSPPIRTKRQTDAAFALEKQRVKGIRRGTKKKRDLTLERASLRTKNIPFVVQNTDFWLKKHKRNGHFGILP